MDITPSQTSSEFQATLATLAEQVARRTGRAEDVPTAWPALSLHRRARPTPAEPCLYAPSVTLVIGGQKRVSLGEESFLLTPGHFLLTSANLPVTPQILEASSQHPFLALMLELDLSALTTLLLNTDLPPVGRSESSRAMALGEATLDLLDIFRRFVRLIDMPRDLPILAPLIQQEILYRVLMSPQGEGLRQMAAVGSHSHRIARAIRWLGTHFNLPLKIEELAEQVGLSASAFHRIFKEVTAMSPLQYQKTLRLSEAQRLMLTQKMDAARAGFEVGYVSASQFSREYRRHFGSSPTSHVATLRQTD
ncbi:AraC family transcriptional regulator [Deinococcus roseus]|uniref:AraC family transcriptional regulator n=1 Tax=Deinococcus roseus TaxID=392414 RepID=A0ABQ2DGV4_9DEIO|nr:AraC family transcriptional regulator [Deinococcus roseus]GGJ57553.1 AraC family transcriptional regulator [Deinococcus roseus]